MSQPYEVWVREQKGWSKVEPTYKSRESAESKALSMMRELPEWETKSVRIFPAGQRPESLS